jgi:hypothetical protein
MVKPRMADTVRSSFGACALQLSTPGIRRKTRPQKKRGSSRVSTSVERVDGFVSKSSSVGVDWSKRLVKPRDLRSPYLAISSKIFETVSGSGNVWTIEEIIKLLD